MSWENEWIAGKLRENFEYFALFHGKIQPVSGVNVPLNQSIDTKKLQQVGASFCQDSN